MPHAISFAYIILNIDGLLEDVMTFSNSYEGANGRTYTILETENKELIHRFTMTYLSKININILGPHKQLLANIEDNYQTDSLTIVDGYYKMIFTGSQKDIRKHDVIVFNNVSHTNTTFQNYMNRSQGHEVKNIEVNSNHVIVFIDALNNIDVGNVSLKSAEIINLSLQNISINNE